MQPVIKYIHKSLIKKQTTVATAESCTGGLLSSYLTQLPGSSQFFVLGVVTYSNQAKQLILKIPGQIIAKKGAVSPEVAKLMAKNIRKIAKSNFGIGITGIAGPGGGTPAKPIGTVFIAVDSPKKNVCRKLFFDGTRSAIRKKTARKALELLKKLCS